MSDIIASPSTRALAGRKGIDLEHSPASSGRETIAAKMSTAAHPALPHRHSGGSPPTGTWITRLRPGHRGTDVALRAGRGRANLAAAQALIPRSPITTAPTCAVEAFRSA
jgi:hypothetical protein